MVKLSIVIAAFHPAIISAMPEGVNVEAVLAGVNEAIAEAMIPSEAGGNIRAKVGKEHVTVSASGKLSGVKFPKDSAAALLARVHWYLEGSKELYTRIGTVTLPDSVIGWIKSKRFALVAA